MIAGTPFILESIDAALARYRGRLARSRITTEQLCWLRWKCLDGEAVCLSCDDATVVIRLEPASDGTMAANVLLAVSGGGSQALQAHEDDVVMLAKDMGADSIRFQTDRPGWARLLGAQWTRDEAGDFRRRL